MTGYRRSDGRRAPVAELDVAPGPLRAPLLGPLRAQRAVERFRRFISGARHDALEYVFVERRELLPLARLVLGHAEVRKSRSVRLFFPSAWPLAAVRHLAQQLAGATLGAELDLGGLVDQRSVLRLHGVGLHGHGLVADVLDLVDAVHFCEGALGLVVQCGQVGAHTVASASSPETSSSESASADPPARPSAVYSVILNL
jgi:hypothetical protein